MSQQLEFLCHVAVSMRCYVPFVLGVNVGSMLQQQLDYPHPVVPCSQVERSGLQQTGVESVLLALVLALVLARCGCRSSSSTEVEQLDPSDVWIQFCCDSRWQMRDAALLGLIPTHEISVASGANRLIKPCKQAAAASARSCTTSRGRETPARTP